METELFTNEELDFIFDALNFYWNDAHTNLERKDLGDIERKNYQHQLDKSNQLLTKLIIC